MQKFFFLLLFCCLPFIGLSQNKSIANGSWKIKLILNDTTQLPFFFEIQDDKQKGKKFSIINGSETIEIVDYKSKGDSLIIDLPIFNSEMKIEILDEYNICGKWFNYAKGPDYNIPLVGYKTDQNRFHYENKDENTFNFSGKYQVLFSTKDSPWVAIGLFKQKKDVVTGTFLTETGDFRYLAGNVNGNKLELSCFDGSHAFYFDGTMKNDSIYGHFYSGNHYSTDWVGVLNQDYEIGHPDSITKTINESDLKFSLIDLDSNMFSFPNDKYKNKVTIIQIMGSWCPNCMDETRYYQKLYEKYHDKGLEIIAVAFETPKSFESKARMLKKLKNHFNIQYKLIIGGNASKKEASEIFTNLNSIVSFPTSIFLDKDMNIRKIHTGFNGPGTNRHFKEYVVKTEALIKKLLKELD